MIASQGDNKWNTHGSLVIFPNASMWDYNEGKELRVFKTTAEKATSQHEWVNGVQVSEGRPVDYGGAVNTCGVGAYAAPPGLRSALFDCEDGL